MAPLSRSTKMTCRPGAANVAHHQRRALRPALRLVHAVLGVFPDYLGYFFEASAAAFSSARAPERIPSIERFPS